MVRGMLVATCTAMTTQDVVDEISHFRQLQSENRGRGLIVRCFVCGHDWCRELTRTLLGCESTIPTIFVHQEFVNEDGNKKRGIVLQGEVGKVHVMCMPLQRASLIVHASCLLEQRPPTSGDVVACFVQSCDQNTEFVRLLQTLQRFRKKPGNNSGVDRRGEAEMRSYGVRACANLQTSAGDVGPYSSGEKSYVAKCEEAMVVRQIAQMMVSVGMTTFPSLIKQHGPFPGNNLSCISLGGTCFSAAHVTVNAVVDRHVDEYDLLGSLIAWGESCRVFGGGFVLLDFLLSVRLRSFTIMHVDSKRWEHGSVPPVCGLGGARFGVALANCTKTITRARNQCAENGSYPFGNDQLYLL